jgi:hypothetical protein
MGKFQYNLPRNTPISEDDLIKDLQEVARIQNIDSLPQSIYIKYGKYDVRNISRRFGSWNKALEKASLNPIESKKYIDLDLYENILKIWTHKGNQPTRRDLSMYPSEISQGPFNRRFKSWNEAMIQFVSYANENQDSQKIEINNSSNSTKTNRDPSLRLRFKILNRDKFKCVKCGASPATDQTIKLHIDHILPWSKGGLTVEDNLMTLCSKCNLGKSNIF